MKLRDYQALALERLRLSLRAGKRRPVLMAPTGAGKTQIAIALIKAALAKGSKVIFTVDRLQLIDQTAKVFLESGLEFGVIQPDYFQDYSKPLQLASVQTLTRRSSLPEVDLLINDECHVVYSRLSGMMQACWKNVPVVGLSATPFTKGLGSIYDDLVVAETTAGLIRQGYLSDFVAWGPPGPDLSGVKTQAGDYNQKELGERVNKTKIVGDVVSTWLKRGENRQTLCFAVNVAHSQAIVSEFLGNGVPAEHIDAYTSTEEREEVIARFEAGQTKILSNCGITTKGFDSPNTDCLILARPTKSLSLHIQMLGRVLRVGDNRSEAIILDHGGNIARLGFPTDPLPEYLCNGKRSENKNTQEAKEKLPSACEKCHHLSTKFVCPKCGHVPTKDHGIEATEDQLKRVEKYSQSEKDRWFGMLLGHSRSKGYDDGWASHKYKEKFGVWPAKKTGVVARSPDEEVRKYIQHLNIKRSKSENRPKKACLASPVVGYDYKAQRDSLGRLQIRVEKDGKFQGFAQQTSEMKRLVGERQAPQG